MISIPVVNLRYEKAHHSETSSEPTAAFLIDVNKTLNQGLEPKKACSTHRFSQQE